jgi:hypothetical protein
MSDLAAHPATAARPSATYSEMFSTPLAIVLLFCLLGLAISAAILPSFAPDEISAVLSHLE